MLEEPESPENSMIEAGIGILFEEEARTQTNDNFCGETSDPPQESNQSLTLDKEDPEEAPSVSDIATADPEHLDRPISPKTSSELVEASLNLDFREEITPPESPEKVRMEHQNSSEQSSSVGKIKLVITMGGQKETVETEAEVVPHIINRNDTYVKPEVSETPVAPTKASYIKPEVSETHVAPIKASYIKPEVSEPPISPIKSPPSKYLGDLDLDLDLDHSIMSDYGVEKKRDSLGDLDDPELNCDFINDKSCDIKIEKHPEEQAFSVKPSDEMPSETVTKLAVSDDISLNIMNEIKVDLKIPEPKAKKVDPTPTPAPPARQNGVDVSNPLNIYNSPSASSSTSSSPRTDTERREKLTLRIPKKDIVLPPENVLLSKKQKSKKRKSKNNYYYADQGGPSSQIPPYLGGGYSPDLYGMYSEEETDLRRISLQQQLLAEKGIKTSSIPVEQTQNLVKNMREKQQTQALPKLTKAPLEHQPMIVLDSGSQRTPAHKSVPVVKDPSLKSAKPSSSSRQPPPYSRSDSSESIRSALKAKINQRRYTDMPSPPSQYTNLSSGNHCCYVVKGSPGECVCSTAPMLFCTKCYHLSHSTCSNILCSNCGALFKFN